MLRIRKYEEKDKADVRHVCLNCDGENTDSQRFNRFILLTYCDYYIENEPENCFVAADENDKAVGYILCTQSFESFNEVFRKRYVPKVFSLGLRYGFNAVRSVDLQRKYSAEYPAHLHIDLLPAYQRQGAGRMLIEALTKHLSEKGISGVMLTVGGENSGGIEFYKSCGFTLLEERENSLAFAMKLNCECEALIKK